MKFKARATAELAKMLRAYDNSNPDVGMGYSDQHWLDVALDRLELSRDHFNSYERAEILGAMNQ